MLFNVLPNVFNVALDERVRLQSQEPQLEMQSLRRSSTAAQGLEHLTLINTGSASCAIEGFALSNAPAVAAAGAGNVASGLSWASSQVINFTFNVANTDTVTGMQFVVELIQ